VQESDRPFAESAISKMSFLHFSLALCICFITLLKRTLVPAASLTSEDAFFSILKLYENIFNGLFPWSYTLVMMIMMKELKV